MPRLTNASAGLLRGLAALVCALAACVVSAADVLPVLKVRQQGDGVYLDAQAHLRVPTEMEAVMRNGVPMVAVQILSVTQSRWYWRDAALLSIRREWTIGYQALTNQWRVSERTTNQSRNYASLAQAWSQVTDVQAWRFADVVELGALRDAQVTLRWYIGRTPLSNLAPITSAATPYWNIDVTAQTQLSQLIAPVRDAVPESRVR